MLGTNMWVVLERLEPSATVLDVGGWYMPFARADHVVDLMPYETRGTMQGPGPERFGPETWTQLDVCRDPLPFADKSVDFVVCSHTLEDIRDPLFLCAELNRVAKAGYLETPSTLAELTFGIESKKYAGWYHHRWLVEMGEGRVSFRHKPAFVHGNWRYHLPKAHSRLMTADQRVTSMLWKGSFSFEERIELDKEAVETDISRFVRSTGYRPEWRYMLVPAEDALRRTRSRIGVKVRRMRTEASR